MTPPSKSPKKGDGGNKGKASKPSGSKAAPGSSKGSSASKGGPGGIEEEDFPPRQTRPPPDEAFPPRQTRSTPVKHIYGRLIVFAVLPGKEYDLNPKETDKHFYVSTVCYIFIPS
ncbi:MAG: hypothetical protein V3W44_00760 [Dehalococcoidales bacterium]